MQRVLWLDLLRILACFAVVALHIVAPLSSCLHCDRGTWLANNIVLSLVTWPVPVFVLISGALLLDRPLHERPGHFYCKRAPFFLRTLFWVLFYVGLRLVSEKGTTLAEIGNGLLIGIPYYHLWFLFMLAGLYLCAPLASKYVVRAPACLRIIVAVAILAAASAVTFLRDVFRPEMRHFAFTLFLPFTGYFLLGHEIKKTPRPGGVPPVFLFSMFVISCAATMFVCYGVAVGKLKNVPLSWLFGAFGPGTILAAASMFLFAREATLRLNRSVRGAQKIADWSPKITILADLVFGVFVLHPIFIRLLTRTAIFDRMNAFFGIPLLTCVVFAWSLLSVWAISRIPYVRKIVV